MESGTRNVPQIRMLPPPPGTFKDREELIAYVQNFAVNHGYVVTIKNSKRESDVYLSCDRGGIPRKRSKGELKRKRKMPSRLINCPFEVVGRKDDDVWVLRIKNGEHNHEPLKDLSEHPYSRRFSEDEVRQIKEMIEAGVKPREVLETLKRNNPELQSTLTHVRNIKAKIIKGKFSETSYKSWKPTSGASSSRIDPMKVSNFIAGNLVNSEGNIFADVVNPATQEVLSQVPSTTYEEFRSAVYAAKQALPSWRNTPVSNRQHIIIKLFQLIRRDIDKLALVISTEQGETIKRARAGILHSLEVVEHACGNRALQMGEYVRNASAGIDMQSIRAPLGVCAGICESNYPAMVPLWMFPISIICGNTFVLKPAEKSPGASMKLVELAMEAGLPDGVLNIVHGGDYTVDHICSADDIKAISFVGSHTMATRIYFQAAARGKRVEANVRCKNQAVVMPDASMDTTLDALVAAGFGGSGDQFMSLHSVIFVGSSAPWLEELIKRAAELKVYEGTDETSDIGPVITAEVKAMIRRSVQNAVEGGARLVLDGRNIMVPAYENGSFVGPTILSGITPTMTGFEEDVLGPLLLCTQVNSLEEAIAFVNQHKVRTGASIYTTSGFTAKKFQNEVEAGLVGVNVPLTIPLPFCSTGLPSSFVGNLDFYGKAGVQFYTQVKLVLQQWKGLTSKRIPSTGTFTLETNLAHQTAPTSMHFTSDFSSHESSSMQEISDTEMTDHERPVNGRYDDDPSNVRLTDSTSNVTLQRLITTDINLSLPQSSEWPKTIISTSHGTKDVLQCPERDSVPFIAQTSGETYTPVPVTLQIPQNDNGSLHSYLPNTISSTLRLSDAVRLPTTDRFSLPLSSHRSEAVGPSSQHIDSSMRLSSEGSSMPAYRGFPFHGEGVYIQTESEVQWNGNMIPSFMDNRSFGHNTSERAHIPMASQRAGSVESMLQSLRPDTVTPTDGHNTSERAHIPMASLRAESVESMLQSLRPDTVAPTDDETSQRPK